MPIGAITMILANVGLQIYNNWCGSRQNAALQQKREEFERAAKDRNTEHMWRLMREGQELTLQLENEKHADRLKELKDEVDHLLERLTYETTISNWPLKVLPIVMKNQAFGNLLANQEENIAMHVVFTRSNYDKFNKLVYPIVEKQLEQYCDKHWSTMTDHPILFYSGAWKPMVNPTDVQVTAMREELKNLPTLLITPFFRPNDGKLVFQLHMWGVGANSTDKFDVPEIEPTEFQRPFCNQDDYDNEEGLLEEIVEDLVPYLECMIGYMADTYFWSSVGLAPHLPLLLTNGTICTDGMKYLINDSREYYDGLLAESEEKAKENPFVQEKLLNLCEGSVELWEKEIRESRLEEVASLYNMTFFGCNNKSLKIRLLNKEYNSHDLQFLKKIQRLSSDSSIQKILNNEIERLSQFSPKSFLRNSFPCYLLQKINVQELDFEVVLHSFETYCNDLNIDNQSILICYINRNVYQFHTYDDNKDVILYNEKPFNFQYKAQNVKNQRSVCALFTNCKTKQLCCRKDRVQYLIKNLNSNVLTY